MNKEKGKYGIVLIGCGHIGQLHICDIYYREQIRIIGVVDVDINKAASFAKMYNADSFDTDYHRYLQDENVDIFIIATYTDSHLEIIIDCNRYGKHVLCEKPVVSNIEQLKALIGIINEGHIKFLAGYILRHNDTYCKVQELIAAGVIGSPILMRMVQNHHAMDWDRYKKLLEKGSPILDCSVHYFDVMQWFTGARITSVIGQGMRVDEDLPEGVYNHGIVLTTLSDGSKGYYEAGWGRGISSSNVKEFIGHKGRIRIIMARDRVTHVEEGDLIELYDCNTKEYTMINVASVYKPMWRQLSCLIRSIKNPEFKGTPTEIEMANAFCVSYYADKALDKCNKIDILPICN